MIQDPPDLVAAARAGDVQALAALYREHAPALLRVCARVGGSAADAEDVVHDLFAGLPELLRGYREQGRLGAWLRGVAVRLTLDRRRLQRRRDALLARAAAEGTKHPPHPLEGLDLARALDRLPDLMRAVLVLRHLEDCPYDEIAAHLGITPGNARVRYLRALRRLRSLMEDAR